MFFAYHRSWQDKMNQSMKFFWRDNIHLKQSIFDTVQFTKRILMELMSCQFGDLWKPFSFAFLLFYKSTGFLSCEWFNALCPFLLFLFQICTSKLRKFKNNFIIICYLWIFDYWIYSKILDIKFQLCFSLYNIIIIIRLILEHHFCSLSEM